MLRSLRTAETAMKLRQAQIDALANNLANVDATGFKQVLTRVAEKGAATPPPVVPYPEANPAEVVNPAGLAETGGQEAQGTATSAARPPAARARTDAARHNGLEMSSGLDARPGPLRETGRMTDVALQGRGFFVVQTPQGEMYTRNGRFSVDAQGRLVNGGGLAVLGAGGPLEVDGPFVVERDGTLTSGGNVVGRLQVVDFADPGRLQHRGESLLAAPGGVAAEPLAPEQVEVVQGQLEGSNVDPVMTLVAMIAAQRAFEIESRLMQAADENMDRAVNQLPAVR